MSDHETKQAVKQCNRVMSMGDDYGDNETTIRCQLPIGHDGHHQESYESERYGTVVITFRKGSTPVQMSRLRHMVPSGECCVNSDGAPCPFLAVAGIDGEKQELACYLSGSADNRIWPSDGYKACDE